MELTTEGMRKRRSFVSYFIFSVVAGGAFIKGLDSFYQMSRYLHSIDNLPLSWNFISDYCLLPFAFFITILRFYIGNVLHMKINEDKPPNKSSYLWLFDFIVIMIQFAIFYFMACSLFDIGLFISLLFFLCLVDIIWIFTNCLMGKLSENLKRNKDPIAWFWLNLACALFLCFLFIFYEGDYLTDAFLGMRPHIWIFLLLMVCAIIDMFFADHYMVIKEAYGLEKEREKKRHS